MLKISSYAIVDTTDSIESERPLVRPSGILQWVLVLGLCALLIFAVLAFGAVDEWSTFAFEAGAAVLFLVWAGKQLVSKELKLSQNPLYLPAFLFFGLILAQIVLRRSAYSYITKYEALQYVSYGIVLLIGAECVREEGARKIFALVMIVFGAGYAFFALAQELTSNGKIFWVHSPQFPWLDLWKLRQPRPLCRPDGDAGADSLCAQYGSSAEGRKASLGRLLRRIDGRHDFPFRLARRNACFRSRNGAVRSTDFREEAKPSHSAGINGSVRLYPGSADFRRQRAGGAGTSRRSEPWHRVWR